MLDILIINAVIVGVCVTIHYEVLYRCAALMPKLSIKGRFRILLGVLVALVAHVVEVWIFALGYYFVLKYEHLGALIGSFSGSILDCVYFSITTYTTLGFGDIEPLGHLRFLVGIEALTGLVLITWTASFLFLEMQRHWRER